MSLSSFSLKMGTSTGLTVSATVRSATALKPRQTSRAKVNHLRTMPFLLDGPNLQYGEVIFSQFCLKRAAVNDSSVHYHY